MTLAAGSLVRMLIDLVRLPSQNPGDDEAAVAACVADRCRALGLEVTTPEVFPRRPNVVALNTHLDTVPAGEGWRDGAFGGVVRDGRVFGLGTSDAKGQAVAMLGALETHGFGCDMTHFRAIGAEAVIPGPGDIDRAHRPDEYIGIDELLDRTRVYANLLERLLTPA